MAARVSQSPELSVADKLHDEIAKLRAQVDSLRNDLKLQTATLMTAESTRQLLQSRTTGEQQSTASEEVKQRLLARFEEQSAHKQRCLYQACASITSFKVKDPDPNAVDGGSVLGLRFEIMSKAKFIRPYYVMLNRPYANRRDLRVHRHTIPQCIPTVSLGRARHLVLRPPPKTTATTTTLPKSRISSRVRLALCEGSLLAKKAAEPDSETAIVDISAADAEAKQISMQWRDGRSGRLIMDDDGVIIKMVAQGDNGRDRETVRQFLGGAVRVEEVTRCIEDR
ncbi:hypothetical protein NUW58_g1454 [Xylaria curta]|uniref:Uncharacterized protein n=1 Tax=Xylaria curta TaxID=42375 RepID=A0ACC1PK42_9PEZI|nr:hypothetical protein NUW58_g1454 [Xylaria curta]